MFPLLVVQSHMVAGNKSQCPAQTQALCTGNWTHAIVIIWILLPADTNIHPDPVIWHCSSLLTVFLGNLLQQPLRQGASKMEDIKMWTDNSRVKGFGWDQTFSDPNQPSVTPAQGMGIPEEPEFQYVLYHISQPHSIHVTSHAPLCYIQNATLLTFMPPFISIYMYMFELYISQLHPYEKYRKRQNTDCIFKLLKGKKSHNRKRKTAVLEFWKNISVKNLLYRYGIPWISLLIWCRAMLLFSPLFLQLKCEKDLNIFTLHSLYINTETTITVRNISKLETKALASLLKNFQNQEPKSRCCTECES